MFESKVIEFKRMKNLKLDSDSLQIENIERHNLQEVSFCDKKFLSFVIKPQGSYKKKIPIILINIDSIKILIYKTLVQFIYN